MSIAILIKIGFIIAGLTVAVSSIFFLAKRLNTITFTLIWIIAGLTLVCTGIFIEPYHWANIIGIPTLIFFSILGISIISLFWYITKKNDELQKKFKEMSINETLLKETNLDLTKQINKIKDNVETNNKEILYLKSNTLKMFETDNLIADNKTTNKKVLFVNNTLSTGGAEKLLLQTMQKFVNDGNKVYLYIMTGMGELINRLPKEVKVINSDFDSESVLSKLGKKKLRDKVINASTKKFTGFKLAGYTMKALIDMIKKGEIHAEKLAWRIIAETAPLIDDKFDIAIAFTEGASTYFVAERVLSKFKISFVHTPYEKAGYTKQLDKNSYDYIDEIITVSDNVKKSFLKIHPECTNKTRVHEYKVNRETLINLSNSSLEVGNVWDLNDLSIEYKMRKTARILTVARLVALKGYDTMIEAASILNNEGINFKWIALGDGEDRDYFQKLIDKYNLNNKFILLGNVSNPYPYMKHCDVYVHATKFEGKSISVMEAKALACPIVLSKVSGSLNQIIDYQTGIYCDYNALDIAMKIKYMLQNPDIANKLGINASKSIENL